MSHDPLRRDTFGPDHPLRALLCRHDYPRRVFRRYFLLARHRRRRMGKCRFDLRFSRGANTTFKFARIFSGYVVERALAARSNVVPRSSRFSVNELTARQSCHGAYISRVTFTLNYPLLNDMLYFIFMQVFMRRELITS